MPRKSTTSVKGGRRRGVEEEKPRKKTCRRENDVVDELPLYFTARKPRSIAMVIGIRRKGCVEIEWVECAESETESPSRRVEIEEEFKEIERVECTESESPSTRVKIEEEFKEIERVECTESDSPSTRVKIEEEFSSTSTAASEQLSSSPSLSPECDWMLPGPVPDFYNMSLDDTLNWNFTENVPFC